MNENPPPPLPEPLGYTCAHCGAPIAGRPAFCPRCGARTGFAAAGPSALRVLGAVLLVLVTLPFAAAGACAVILAGLSGIGGGGGSGDPVLFGIAALGVAAVVGCILGIRRLLG